MSTRIYDKNTMISGIQSLAKLQQKAYPPMSAQTMALPQPEMAEGHCVGCKTKRSFVVENTETMKNGALRKSGKCTEPGCGTAMSTFVSGATSGSK